jgi:hypothetical protein
MYTLTLFCLMLVTGVCNELVAGYYQSEWHMTSAGFYSLPCVCLRRQNVRRISLLAQLGGCIFHMRLEHPYQSGWQLTIADDRVAGGSLYQSVRRMLSTDDWVADWRTWCIRG